VHDDWESPTLGAWGLGWEVWLDGMEILQFTYFQACGGQTLKPITAEITYGTERVARYLQKVESSFDLHWNDSLTYGDIYHRNEQEWSQYNFEHASTEMWFRHFQDYENEAKRLIGLNLPLPAYDFVLKASHAFNMLEARRFFSVTERTGYIARIRDLARLVAEEYLASRELQGFPLLKASERPSQPLVVPPIAPALRQVTSGQTADFLLEIGSEELPATFVPMGMRNLEKNLRQLLEKEKIAHGAVKVYGTPRRLAIAIADVALARAAESVDRRGPALSQAFDASGHLTKAGEGFFRSVGMTAPDYAALVAGKIPHVAIREVKGERHLVVQLHTPARPTAEILAEALGKLIANLEFPKRMRWGDGDILYARPLRWIVALLGQHIVPFAVHDLVSGRVSRGHRQRAPGEITIAHARDYLPRLREFQVLADVDERQASIESQLQQLEKKLNGQVLARERVMPQVVHLVECPTLLHADFNADFLQVPPEVLISEMVEHQKYFPLGNADGTLRNLFVITADTVPTDEIRQGNQKVLSARLFDGSFLYQQDLKTPLTTFNDKLKQMTYQKDLGTVFEKVERLIAHVTTFHRFLPLGDLGSAKRAALLCKADLSSEMVGEFPELQGTIGRTYALAHGETPTVAQAIEEHWMPKGEGAALPASPTGTLLSLAERFDNILGCFAVGLQPTSSSDPYGLRRQMLGIVRMLIQGKHHLPLDQVLKECFSHFPKRYPEMVAAEVQAFITSRIKTVFLEYQFRKDEIEASLAQTVSDIYDTFLRIDALHRFRATSPHFPLLFEVYKRAKGQLQGQSAKAFRRELLQEPAEKALDELLTQTERQVQVLLKQRDYGKAYELMAELQPALAQLFLDVKILADEVKIRDNRIALLQRVFALFAQLLDFDKIQESAPVAV
jgi:glycyl-tRNA synthetase